MTSPPLPPVRVFAEPAHRAAAAAIVATVTAAHNTRDGRGGHIDAVASLYADVETAMSPLDVVVAAAVIVTKLLADEHTVWRVDPSRTIARMGQWVAADEVA